MESEDSERANRSNRARRQALERSTFKLLGEARLGLGRKALTALGAATSENLLTAGRQHALAEAVAALANNAARLIRALHGKSPSNVLRSDPALDRKRDCVVFSVG